MIANQYFPARIWPWFLLATAMTCGSLIMVVEVMGSRVIGPFFGVSLFVWTSLISVAMIALALGYGLGGRFADKYPDPVMMYLIIMIAGLLVLLIPVLKASVIGITVPLGLRMGAFVASVLLFGPSLFLLGCVSPYLIRVSASEMATIGKTVGGFYAISTLGSVLGTILTGFVLVAWLGVTDIFLLAGSVLIGLASLYMILARQFKWLMLLLLAPLFMLLQPDKQLPDLVMSNGTRVQLLSSQDSHYGNLKIVEYSNNDIKLRELLIDGLVQGGVDTNNGMSVFEYSYFLQFLPMAMKPDISSVLVVGMGAGIIPRWYDEQGIAVDVVDIDEAIYEMSDQWFGARQLGQNYVADARYFLSQPGRQYDLIVVDVFTGDATPGHLLTMEAMQLMKSRLAPGGMLTMNLAGDLTEEGYMTASVVKTLGQHFEQVELVPVFNPSTNQRVGNVVVMAYQGEIIEPDYRHVYRQPVHVLARAKVYNLIRKRYQIPESRKAIILTDNYSPIEFFESESREEIRRLIIKGTPDEILLYSS